MNLPFTMDINQASSAVLEFKPKIVYPFHYRGQGGLSDVEAFKKLVAAGGTTIEVRLRNWYPQ
jgi:L-ascorbate metabolism protein UlaG (beta-lactamase superfamily)